MMLNEIKQNFEKLIALYESEREKNTKLSEELARSRGNEESLMQEISGFKKEIENLKLTGAFAKSTPSAMEAKEKVAKMIREIDKCISLLES